MVVVEKGIVATYSMYCTLLGREKIAHLVFESGGKDTNRVSHRAGRRSMGTN